jgi:DNA repair exonuclease SbcCD ATPase subunit
MIKSLQCTNFRKQRSTNFTFDEGLTVIRGSNEASKSTTLEAIAYALFGVKAIRSSLADAVTWGESESSLKVVLALAIDGVTYSVSRGKSGAECTYEGGIVTGQSEVTNFISSKLRVDASSASRLMLSTQLNIRGALEAGPKATTELIEKLSEFSQIDNLIELMQEKLTLGSAATALAQLDSAQTRLGKALEVEEPSFTDLEKQIEGAQAELDLAKAEHDRVNAVHAEAQKAYARVQAQENERRRVKSQFEQKRAKFIEAAGIKAELDRNPVKAYPSADPEIQALLERKRQAATLADCALIYKQVQPLLGDELPRFNGTAAEWQTRAETLQSTLDSARKERSAAEVAIVKLEAAVNSGSCTFCGKDFSDLPEIKAKNAELQGQIAKLRHDIAHLDSVTGSAKETLANLKDIQTEGRPTLANASKYAQYLVIDESVYPPILTWNGEVPTPANDRPDYDAQIADIKAKVKAFDQFMLTLRDAELDLKRYSAEVESLEQTLSGMGPQEDQDDAAKALAMAAADVRGTLSVLDDAKGHKRQCEYNLKDARRVWDQAQAEIAGSRSELETAQTAVKDLEFNNALLKRVRAARPLIGDKLWNLTLAAVSSYFSEMRGVRSKVTKESDGFKVDGHPVETLSGSTLDILGLAVRVALVRTFLPGASFLVLDEPCASMDAARTEALLGFLSSVGFKQVLLVTHEDVSESVADRVITLGDYA